MMITSGYDEDVFTNRFFTTLQNKHKHLYEKATASRCMICVPRTGVFVRHSLTQKDFENHILQADEEQPGFFTSWNGKELQITTDGLATRKGFESERIVHVLFEETFYNDSDESFKVVCIDRLLEGGTDIVEDPVLTCLETVDDCAEFLWGHKYSKSSQQHVDDKIQSFLDSHQQFQSTRAIIDATCNLFTSTMQIALKDSVLKKLVKQNKGHMENLKVAMETYVMNAVSAKVLKQLIQLMANEDSKLNKTTRNLSDLQVKDLRVRQEFTVNLPRARRELSQLNQFNTPLEKLHCLRRTVGAITQPGYRDKLQLDGSGPAMSSDDLLPLLIFLVVKSEIPNWLANLAYMQHFRFANFGHGEFGFYLASFEAAIEHVRSGSLSSLPMGSPDGPRLSIFSRSPSTQESLWQRLDGNDGEYTPSLELFFKCARENDTERLESMLESGFTDDKWILSQMCHPLCLCDKCQDLLISTRSDPRALTSSSRNDRGYTAMHTAAINNNLQSMEVLYRYKGDINATDYHGSSPLHLACQRGHQDATIWLLDKGADMNLEDNDGNTPLHLCCANGHEECVKTLLYAAYGPQKIEINAANSRGDTPLHLAAKWGYENIVVILLENGSSLEARNRRKETPLMCSQNLNIAKRLVAPTEDGHAHQEMEEPATALETILSRQTSNSSSTSAGSQKHRRSKSNSSLTSSKEVEKLLRSVADGDIIMVRHQLGWSSDEDDEIGEEMETWSSNTELCHPLCQCNKCSVLQKRTLVVMDSGLNVNSCNSEGYSPLHVACLHGHASLVDLLLRRGSNVNSWNNTSMQSTPLHLACQYDHASVVSKLLKFGAKCNMKDTNGNSPLHYCCMNGYYNSASILIAYGANVDQNNYRGNTPLHEAARGNYAKMVKLLLEDGKANPLSRNKAQLTPLQLAQSDVVVHMIESAISSVPSSQKDDSETTTSSNLSQLEERDDEILLYLPAEDDSQNVSQDEDAVKEGTQILPNEEKLQNTETKICNTAIQ